jgi:hypothetical protein
VHYPLIKVGYVYTYLPSFRPMSGRVYANGRNRGDAILLPAVAAISGRDGGVDVPLVGIKLIFNVATTMKSESRRDPIQEMLVTAWKGPSRKGPALFVP